MTVSRVLSASLLGVDAELIQVEAHVSKGLSKFSLVGLPDSAVRESENRIFSAIEQSGIKLPVRKIVVNLAPANLKKIGSGFDLPIAMAILGGFEIIPPEALQDYLMLGELALDGSIRHVCGALSSAMMMQEKQLQKLILPSANTQEAKVIPNLQIFGANCISEVIAHFQNESPLSNTPTDQSLFEIHSIEHSCGNFQDVKGQSQAKRVLEVSAAGRHHVLMVGVPGSGKTMLARRMPSILPPMRLQEALDVTRIFSAVGELCGSSFIKQRPFRSPNHTISTVGLVGGGRHIPQPGEISLAHRGILFLDELPEFRRDALEALRQPWEDRKVRIARANFSVELPCDFLLIAAMNPCPCGYSGASPSSMKQCTCSPEQVRKYRSKISGPLMDRFDLQIKIPAMDYETLSSRSTGESSQEIQQRVQMAHQTQVARFQQQNSQALFNGDMTSNDIDTCIIEQLEQKAEDLLGAAVKKFGLSARAYHRILKVSRTIADLAESPTIESIHVSEAIQYRILE